MGFIGTPLLKGCLRKLQTHYVYYAHTGATHFSFNSSNNARVSTSVSRIRHAHGLRARIYYQKHVATIETMSKASERITGKAYSCIAPSAVSDGDIYAISMRTLIFLHLTRITSCFASYAPEAVSRL